MDQPNAPLFNFFRRIFPTKTATPATGITPSVKTSTFSTTLAKNDPTMLSQQKEALKYKSYIEKAAQQYSFQPSILCGIGSRESHWGLALKPVGPSGRGDFALRPARPSIGRTTAEPPDGGGYGRGLMQIDYDWHEFARTGAWQDPNQNILYACKVLDDARRFLRQKGLPEDLIIRGMLAAYNGGATATWNAYVAGNDIDANTTGKDYSRDVLSRSGWFQFQGWA